jgi:endonuclease/exonuclease/phosphatase family metal-dependent hydrolase
MCLQHGVVLAAMVSASVALTGAQPCAARADRVGGAALRWLTSAPEDATTLNQWCRAVGPPVYVPRPVESSSTPPALADVVVMTWNAHLAEGRLTQLIAALRGGEFTNGISVRHFVLLVQELYRRGPDVPAFSEGMRSAHAIRARDEAAPDVHDYAVTLGLSLLYVPSMRNGSDVDEDRGNAILSTEPLSDAVAFDLPFARQRRVAIGAAIEVMRPTGRSTLRLVDIHLEPLSSPQTLWLLRNPRGRQVRGVLSALAELDDEANWSWGGTVLGGDFNTIQSGAKESAYAQARAWSTGLAAEDPRNTHMMGRLDYLFFRLPDADATVTRIDRRFGSDHYPLLGRFSLAPHKIPG